MTNYRKRSLEEIVAVLRQAADIWFSADLHRTLEELIAVAQANHAGEPREPAKANAPEVAR
jgi:hypothetical protein